MKVSKVALAAATMLGGSAMLIAAPASAQSAQAQRPAQPARQAQPAGREFTLSSAERAALQPLIAANEARNWAAVQAALPAARAAAQGADAKYLVARVELAMALANNNKQAQSAAIDAVIASGSAPASELPALLNAQAEIYFAAGNFAAAERNYVRLQQLAPNDSRILQNLSVVRSRMGNSAGAIEPVLQQIRTAEAAGQTASEDLYKRAFQLSYRARQRPQAAEGLGRLLRAYPSAANWRTGVDFAREGAGSDNQHVVDVYRFARAANVVQGPEYLAFATTLNQAGLPGETKAVIDAGIAAGAVQQGQASQLLSVANRRIGEDRSGLPGQISQARSAANGRQARVAADTLYGYGRYQEAADLYRMALSKGGEDANMVNTRLGASLAMAGQRSQAETALRAVTGARADLAQLWLAWLARRAS